MKMIKVKPARMNRFQEFPELVFFETEENNIYFDATHYLEKAENNQKLSFRDFDLAFTFWKSAISSAYNISFSELVVLNKDDNHVLMDETLSLLFVAYTDPDFAVHLLERMTDMLVNGVVMSDSALMLLTKARFSREDLLNITQDDQKE